MAQRNARRYRKVLSRRTLLRGAAGVTIALPFLDEMVTTSLFAAPPEPPKRLVTLFFGNGVLPRIFNASDALSANSPLSPLRSVLPKISVLRGIDMNAGTSHPNGGGATFVGFTGREGQQRGPSIDIRARNQLHPSGVPTKLQALLVASYFRGHTPYTLYRMTHSWNEDGSQVGRPIERPTALFTELFGQTSAPINPTETKEGRFQKSVLDTVINDYRHITGERSNLGGASRARIANHLERVREIERSIFDPINPANLPPFCRDAQSPSDPNVPYGVEANRPGVEVQVDAWTQVQNELADLYAMALRCDLVRFGNLTFQASGERVQLRGRYNYNGQNITFNDRDAHHEYWHDQIFPEVEWHTHYIMSQFAYFMQQLDDASYLDENGRTLLDNALIMMGAELGNGSGVHDTKNVFHAITSANERFRVGGLIDVDASSVDVYNTCLEALGVTRRMGDQNFYKGTLNSILA